MFFLQSSSQGICRISPFDEYILFQGGSSQGLSYSGRYYDKGVADPRKFCT